MNNNNVTEAQTETVIHEHSAVKIQSKIRHTCHALTEAKPSSPGFVNYAEIAYFPRKDYSRRLAIDYIYTQELYINGSSYSAHDAYILLSKDNDDEHHRYHVRLELNKQVIFPTLFGSPLTVGANVEVSVGISLIPQQVSLPIQIRGYMSLIEERV